jgi:hypothetical protein
MSEPNTNFWYRLGRNTARLTRLMIVVFGLAIGALAFSGSIGSPWRTILLVLGCVFGALAVFITTVVRRQPAIFATGVYILLVVAGSIVRGGGASDAALIVIAIGTIVSGAAIVLLVMRAGRKSKELERMLFSEATSMAFFITMLGAITYALLEAWLDVPKISMWVPWSIGMGSWAILSVMLGRRYS